MLLKIDKKEIEEIEEGLLIKEFGPIRSRGNAYWALLFYIKENSPIPYYQLKVYDYPNYEKHHKELLLDYYLESISKDTGLV